MTEHFLHIHQAGGLSLDSNVNSALNSYIDLARFHVDGDNSDSILMICVHVGAVLLMKLLACANFFPFYAIALTLTKKE